MLQVVLPQRVPPYYPGSERNGEPQAAQGIFLISILDGILGFDSGVII